VNIVIGLAAWLLWCKLLCCHNGWSLCSKELVCVQIVGNLWDHCEPPNLDGLYSQNAKSYPNRVEKGWDSLSLYGNFLLLSTEWWYNEKVQTFVDLVLATGGHFRFRWNEQAVIAMLWQMLCPDKHFVLFDFPFEHPCSDQQYPEAVHDVQ
jgi:hypothetical protein